MRAAVCCVLLLAGCATAPAPSVVIGHVDPLPAVTVPIVVGCIDPAQIPVVPPSSMPPSTAGVAELAGGAAADALKYRDLAARQNDLLRACAAKPKGPQP